MTWVFFAGLSVFVIAAMLTTLRKGKSVELDRQKGSAAILLDQLSEIERDMASGLISTSEAEGARLEVKRRLLRVGREMEEQDRGSADKNTAGSTANSGVALLVILTIAVPVAAFGLYARLGDPTVASKPFLDRQQEREEARNITDLTNRLKSRLMNDENGGPTEGWVLLTQTYMRMGQYEDAVASLEPVLERPDVDSYIFSQFAETLVARDNGLVTPRAERAILRALELDSTNPAAIFYSSLALEQGGNAAEAYQVLRTRLEAEESFAPWMEIYAGRINQLADQTGQAPILPGQYADTANSPPGPNQAQVDAASEMSEEDRASFVRSMVDRLATRLAEEPEDLDGWLRLANAYKILGDIEPSRQAYERAQGLIKTLPENDPRREAVRLGLAELGG